MRKTLVILFLIFILAINFAAIATLVEVRVNSLRIPSMSAHRSGIDSECRITSRTRLQVHDSSDVPIAGSFGTSTLQSIEAGSSWTVAFLRESGKTYSLKLATWIGTNGRTGQSVNQNCMEIGQSQRMKVWCGKNQDGRWLNPCNGCVAGVSFNCDGAQLAVTSNCRFLNTTGDYETRDGFCFNLGPV